MHNQVHTSTGSSHSLKEKKRIPDNTTIHIVKVINIICTTTNT